MERYQMIARIAEIEKKLHIGTDNLGDIPMKIYSGEFAALRTERDLLKRELGIVQSAPAQTDNNLALKPIPWIGTDVAFTDLIKELRKKGYIEAGSDMAALECAAPHFENINRDARVLIQGEKNQRNYQDKGTFSCIPPAKKRKRNKPTSN